mmetsp:Transcript_3932/g.9586  ORF Transcript_3932/g.9586 Transcript_3932/m.9586 type:complete len:589 (-) Transcript_3932:1527-3293(-)
MLEHFQQPADLLRAHRRDHRAEVFELLHRNRRRQNLHEHRLVQELLPLPVHQQPQPVHLLRRQRAVVVLLHKRLKLRLVQLREVPACPRDRPPQHVQVVRLRLVLLHVVRDPTEHQEQVTVQRRAHPRKHLQELRLGDFLTGSPRHEVVQHPHLVARELRVQRLLERDEQLVHVHGTVAALVHLLEQRGQGLPPHQDSEPNLRHQHVVQNRIDRLDGQNLLLVGGRSALVPLLHVLLHEQVDRHRDLLLARRGKNPSGDCRRGVSRNRRLRSHASFDLEHGRINPVRRLEQTIGQHRVPRQRRICEPLQKLPKLRLEQRVVLPLTEHLHFLRDALREEDRPPLLLPLFKHPAKDVLRKLLLRPVVHRFRKRLEKPAGIARRDHERELEQRFARLHVDVRDLGVGSAQVPARHPRLLPEAERKAAEQLRSSRGGAPRRHRATYGGGVLRGVLAVQLDRQGVCRIHVHHFPDVHRRQLVHPIEEKFGGLFPVRRLNVGLLEEAGGARQLEARQRDAVSRELHGEEEALPRALLRPGLLHGDFLDLHRKREQCREVLALGVHRGCLQKPVHHHSLVLLQLFAHQGAVVRRV